MKYSLGISNFLEETSSLSHSVAFLYFFALISEEGFLISSCYSLELCIQMQRREWRSWWRREKDRKSTRTRDRKRKRKRFGSSFYMFSPRPGPALCKLGLARSAVCSGDDSGIPLLVLGPSLTFLVF